MVQKAPSRRNAKFLKNHIHTLGCIPVALGRIHEKLVRRKKKKEIVKKNNEKNRCEVRCGVSFLALVGTVITSLLFFSLLAHKHRRNSIKRCDEKNQVRTAPHLKLPFACDRAPCWHSCINKSSDTSICVAVSSFPSTSLSTSFPYAGQAICTRRRSCLISPFAPLACLFYGALLFIRDESCERRPRVPSVGVSVSYVFFTSKRLKAVRSPLAQQGNTANKA